jgi:hypothetical protein
MTARDPYPWEIVPDVEDVPTEFEPEAEPVTEATE